MIESQRDDFAYRGDVPVQVGSQDRLVSGYFGEVAKQLDQTNVSLKDVAKTEPQTARSGS